MPIISTIGRKSPKVRLLVGCIYALLLGGATTMVYPFLLMIAGTTKSNVDTPEAEVIPSYLVEDDALYRKYAESFFNESNMAMNASWEGTGLNTFRNVELPLKTTGLMVKEWEAFLDKNDLSWRYWTLAFCRVEASRMVLPENLRLFREEMLTMYNNDLDMLNREMKTMFGTWTHFNVPVQRFYQRRIVPLETPFADTFREFCKKQPRWQREYLCIDRFYALSYVKTQYASIEEYNKTHGTAYSSFEDVHLTRKVENGEKQQQEWGSFVRTILNLFWIRIDTSEEDAFRAFLKDKYLAVSGLNKAYGSTYKSFGEVPFHTSKPEQSAESADWSSFLQGWKNPDTGKMHQAELKNLSVDNCDFMFRDYLKVKYVDVESLNRACGTDYKNWLSVLPPQQELHLREFDKIKSHLKWEFSTRNFITVLDTVLLHGRAVMNTVVYCALAILSALIVNPIAAYGLSRYKPPSSYKILLFLMMTMAFPPMVTQIPNFLMLRELNLLNTFWALVLPGLANGYSIFLLKGFFDSLPQELYEAAEIDGASEFRIFWQITMSLSKPILAVIALGAFTGAYSNFMMALLICQDDTMWTIMPWLYQLQQFSTQGVVYASLIVAAVPTFIIFVFCQNIIMRGIVVPVEK